MSTELRWLASFSASCFHAVGALRGGEAIVDAELAAALAEPTDRLAKEITACGLPEQQTLDALAGYASGIENNTELATVMLTKIRGRNETTDVVARRLAGRIADLEAAVRRTKPGLVDELALRGEPLKEQWDARGPGLLMRLGQLTDELLIPSRADVVLVCPAVGGHGVAHLPTNSVRIEAVLANPLDALPEVVRLAWLIAQLQCDLPVLSERVHRDRLPQVAALAMLSPTLSAAEHVELVRSAAETTRIALTAWKIVLDGDASQTADMLSTWWQTCLDNPPHWSVALAALDRMMLPDAGEDR